jgi:hypothetical protein
MASGDRGDVATGGRANPVRRSVRVLGVGLLAMAANAFPQLATATPGSAYQWVLLWGGAFADALVVGLSLDRLFIAAPSRLHLPTRIRAMVRLRVLIAVAVAGSLLVGVGFAATSVWYRVDRIVNGCPEPVELRVLTTVDSLVPTQQLARTFERDSGDRGCPTINVYVYSAGEPQTRDALAGGWAEDALRQLGPRPDVWLPDSMLEVDDLLSKVSHDAGAVPIDRAQVRSIAWSPIVVGVPGPVPLGTIRTDLGWDDLLAQADALPGGLVRPQPDTSLIGQLATNALYAGLGPTSGETPRSVELRIERSLDAGGYPLDDTLDELGRQRAANPPKAAIITSEQALVRFNLNDPSGGECAIPPDISSPALTALYPRDAPSLDHPFVRLNWDRTATPQSGAATRLRQWLDSDDGKAALNCVGLRPPPGFELGDPLTAQFGVQPGASFVRSAPSPGAIDGAMQKYAAARRTGRVLFVLDTSASMAQLATDGRTRLSIATDGVRNSLDLMSGGDQFGLWTFPGTVPARATRELVPIGARDTPVRGVPRQQATEAALAALRPDGGTPLLPAIIEGVGAVGPAAGDQVRALVVLTDGEDASGLTADAARNTVRRQGVRVFVVAVGEASCTGPVADVASSSGGGCYEAGFDAVGRQLTQLFDLLWGGDGHGA